MIVNSAHNFPEAGLGPDFAKEKLTEFKALIDTGLSFVVVSMPGVGVSCFLKYLASQNLPAGRQGFARSPSLPARNASLAIAGGRSGVSGRATFIHVDLYSLPSLSIHEFYKLLLSELGGKPEENKDEKLLEEIKKTLKQLSEKWDKIVIIFSRFDQLKSQFTSTFLSNIQSLTTVSQKPIVEIFTSTKSLYEIAPDALTGGNLNFYSENLYFKPYSKEDLKQLLKVDPAKPVSASVLNELLKLSGGHNQLFRILLSSQKQQNLLLDNFVKMQMKELIGYLDYHQKKTLQKIALGKRVDEVDEYLLGIGMVTRSVILSERSESRQSRGHSIPIISRMPDKVGMKSVSKDLYHFDLFTPLLAEYIKTNMPVKLPVKEAKLFKLLRANMGKTVSKDEIFKDVWPGDEEGATDWALDALIYRLRKHPFMKAHGYIIESQKKVGYALVQP